MSEVMRWKLKGFLPGVEGMCKAVMRPEVVMASDYDAAQSELAALREELADTKANLIDYQQRLADAERRNAEQLQELVKARALIEQASKFRATTFSDCSDLIISLQAFSAETKHADEYVAIRRDLLNTACNGFAQEQGHALNEMRDLLAALKPTESEDL